MARIPVPKYRREQAADSSGPMPRAANIGVPENFGSEFQQLGRAGEQLAGAIGEREAQAAQAVQRSNDNVAAVWAEDALSKTQLQWTADLQRRRDEAPAGPMEGFTPSVLKDFDDYATKTIDGAPSEKARFYLQKRMGAFRTSLGVSALAMEATGRNDWITDTTTQSTNRSATLLYQDPSEYSAVAAEHLAVIDSLALPAAQKSKLRDNASRTLAFAASSGVVRANPQLALERLTGVEAHGSPVKHVTESGEKVDSAPRGIRNNNPGNIVKGATSWEGKVESPDTRYEAFATPEHGIRALASNLISYNDRHGINTVEGIISRWAPASENATAAYISAVAKDLKVKPGDKIDVKNPAVLRSLTLAIIKHENGGDPYSDAQVSRGVKAALGEEKLEAPAKGTQVRPYLEGAVPENTGIAAFDALTLSDRMQLVNQAQAAINREQADARARLQSRLVDAGAMAVDGKRDPNPIPMGEFVRAYGQGEGAAHYEAYQRSQDLASDISTMQTMPAAERQQMLERTKAVTGQGYAQADKRWQVRAQADAQLRKQEVTDPIGAAIARNIGGAAPLAFGDEAAMRAELNKRVGVAEVMASQYQTPHAILTNTEAQQLSGVLAASTTQQKLSLLKTIRQSVTSPEAFRTVLRQIAPDSPVTAAAAAIAEKSYTLASDAPGIFTGDLTFKAADVAGIVLEGEAILNKTRVASKDDGKVAGKGFMPPEKDLRAAFEDHVGVAFAGDAAGAETAFQVYRAYYAGQSARTGDVTGDFNSDRAKLAAQVATGGVLDFNGRGKVLKPWGMPDAEFKNAVSRAWTRAAQSAGLGEQVGKLPAYGLQSSGDSRYLLTTGTDFLRGKDGRPIELNLKPYAAPVLPGPK